jgi:hypothetical protein
MRVSNEDELQKLFYDFRDLVLDLNELLHLLVTLFCKVNVGDIFIGNLGNFVNDLYRMKSLVEKYIELGMDIKDSYRDIDKKFRHFTRQIRKGLGIYRDLLVWTEEGDRPLKGEFEYCEKVGKQNLNVFKKWCKGDFIRTFSGIMGTRETIMNDEEAIYMVDDFKLR